MRRHLAALRRNPLVAATLMPVAAFIVELVGSWSLAQGATRTRPLDVVAVLLLGLGAGGLALRRRHPVPVLAVAVATALVYDALHYPGGFYTVAIALATYSCVSAGKRVEALVGGLAALLILAVIDAHYQRGHLLDHEGALWYVGWMTAAFVLGEAGRGRQAYLSVLEQRALHAERTREEEARRRAGEERLRVARELHDVLAQRIAVISVQASVAVHLLDTHPEQAGKALVVIKQASKEALGEMRATLGLLRQGDEHAPRAPTPGLENLDALVQDATAAGLSVRMIVRGKPEQLTPDVDIAAYRILQESLTNVSRHAGTAAAVVAIEWHEHEVLIRVDNNGLAGTPVRSGPPGSGIVGMRERAAILGGRLHAGPRPDGGFRVEAQLPLLR